MSNVQKPEPVAYWNQVVDQDCAAFSYAQQEGCYDTPLMTLDQAEAYADERVREALENAVSAIENLRTSGTIRYAVVEQCADAVRALSPKQ